MVYLQTRIVTVTFVRKINGTVYHQYQTAPNGGWSSWVYLGSSNVIGDPVVGQNADGCLHMFVRKTDGAIYHRWQTVPNGGWSSSFASLGGNFQFDPLVTSNADGRLEVFVRGTDDAGIL